MYDPKSSKLAKLRSVARIARARAKEGHASVGRQLIEIIRLWLANGMTAPDYYCTGLYRKDLPWREKTEHLGARPYTRGLRCVNDKRYEYLAQNKLAAYGLFRAFNLPTPKVHAVVGREAGHTWDGRTVATSEDLVDTIRKIGESRLCFKLVDGWSGKGFIRADVLVGGESVSLAIDPDGKAVTVEEFWGDVIRRNGSYMIQSVIEQHQDVARFNPSSVNTARVWIMRSPGGCWKPYAAVFRMGVGDVAVDNRAGSQIMSRVELESGSLSTAVDESVNRLEYDTHPTSGMRIEGEVLPMWDRAIELCLRASALVPFLRLVAFDVAFAAAGPLLLELESVPGDDQVGFDRGVKTLFSQLSRLHPGA